MFILQIQLGVGKHAIVLLMDPVRLSQGLKLALIQSQFNVTGISLVKVSIGFFLLRLCNRTGYAKFIWATISARSPLLGPGGLQPNFAHMGKQSSRVHSQSLVI